MPEVKVINATSSVVSLIERRVLYSNEDEEWGRWIRRTLSSQILYHADSDPENWVGVLDTEREEWIQEMKEDKKMGDN